MLRSQGHEADTEDRIRTGGEHIDDLFVSFKLEGHTGPFGPAYPIGLGFF